MRKLSRVVASPGAIYFVAAGLLLAAVVAQAFGK